MPDPVILVTPVLVLGVLLLLGFAGCSFEGGTLTPALYILVRVPTALTVTEIVFRAVNPNGVGSPVPVPDPTPAYVDGNDNVFSHHAGDPVPGGWMMGCRVTVRENGATATAGAQRNVIVATEQDYLTAVFQASGTPSGGDFTVVPVGMT